MSKPTARELLDWIHEVHLKTGCTCQKTGSLPCDAYRIAARVEKVLAEVQHHRRSFPLCNPGMCAWCDVERLLNGEEL